MLEKGAVLLMILCNGVAHPRECGVITRRGLECHRAISGMHISKLRYFAHMENSTPGFSSIRIMEIINVY